MAALAVVLFFCSGILAGVLLGSFFWFRLGWRACRKQYGYNKEDEQ